MSCHCQDSSTDGETSVSDTSLVGVSGSNDVEVLEARELWSEYRLADGTVLRVKPIMIAVSRAEDSEATNGEPVYNMKSTLVTDVRSAKSASRAK
jgi:hypothetical protein